MRISDWSSDVCSSDLSERELSTLLNVSRSAVREAVKILVSIEILEVKHGRGTFVREPQLRPLTDLSMVENAVKTLLMRQAIEARALIDIERSEEHTSESSH